MAESGLHVARSPEGKPQKVESWQSEEQRWGLGQEWGHETWRPLDLVTEISIPAGLGPAVYLLSESDPLLEAKILPKVQLWGQHRGLAWNMCLSALWVW